MTGDRIGWFFGGTAIATLCGIVTYCLCLLIQMGIDPALDGEPYWDEIGERLSNNLLVACMMFTASAGTLLGIFLMAKALFDESLQSPPVATGGLAMFQSTSQITTLPASPPAASLAPSAS